MWLSGIHLGKINSNLRKKRLFSGHHGSDLKKWLSYLKVESIGTRMIENTALPLLCPYYWRF
jgi:hypothetical protein